MKNTGIIFAAVLSLATALASVGFAADPMPQPPTAKAKAKEKVETMRQSGGAIKLEDQPAVPAEQLNDPAAPTTPAVAPAANEAPSHTEAATVVPASESAHLFGLHAALGAPHPINYGVDWVLPSHMFSFGLQTGSYSATISDVNAKLENTDVALRWHPFAGAFFLGALVGQQKVSATKTEFIAAAGQNVTATGEVKSSYVTPHVGWMWGLGDGGFFWSFELGYQSPSSVTVDVSSDVPAFAQNSAEYQEQYNKVKDEADKYGNMGLPYLGLIKFGWLF